MRRLLLGWGPPSGSHRPRADAKTRPGSRPGRSDQARPALNHRLMRESTLSITLPLRPKETDMLGKSLVAAVAALALGACGLWPDRSEEHTSELQSLMRISYAVFCLKKKKYKKN